MIIEEIIAKYDVDANLFRLGYTNPTKKIQILVFFGLLYRRLIVGGAFVRVVFVRGLLSGGFSSRTRESSN